MAASARSRRRGRICLADASRRCSWGCLRLRQRGGCSLSAWKRCGCVVRVSAEPPRETAEVVMSGQLALAVSEERLVAAAVWEALPPEVQREVTVRLARLLARLVEAERDE